MALRDRFRLLLTIKDSPHRIALAFALGVFIGMSPFLGVHTVLALLVAWIFRLNKLATIVGVYVTNPWTIIPIYTFSTWVGAKFLGIGDILPHIDWRHLTIAGFLNEFSYLIMPFVVGTLLIGAVSSIVSYIVLFRITKRVNG